MRLLRTTKKVLSILKKEIKQRGFYHFLIMYKSNLSAVLRGLLYQLLYMKNIKSRIFFIGSRSRFDIYNSKSKITIGDFVYIRKNSTLRVDFYGQLNIGDKVAINDNCNISCIHKISIGSYTKIGQNVCIYDHDHNYRKRGDDRLLTGEVVIGKNVWIGSNVVILRGSIIGDNAVIAAGSVVKGKVPGNSLYLNKRHSEIIQYDQERLVVL
ncbi:acyltransferase [Clostridium thermarum]|uniref:acyltransferase n=2 Tax=Clostridium thermarum TaxID=1716543 RepID=UPI001FAD370C|nr:acyltransferase [Clostridium thermarum]